ncbi:MAG TPA: RNA polymerase sigma factor [Candidatus Angelobacter sp.]|nr:RNA polymerase sigma factor [Candidatus Angelobacter sp.]
MAVQAVLGERILKQAGTSEAKVDRELETLVAEHAGMVFRIAYSILRNHQDAEDAAQEAFLRALKFQRRAGKVRNPKTWIARIAWTAALDRRAERPPVWLETTESDEVEQVPAPLISADDHLAGREMQRLLELLIAGLPDDLRRPLELSTVQELTSAEIGEVMGIPEGSVRTRLLRARQLLKEKMAALVEAKQNG